MVIVEFDDEDDDLLSEEEPTPALRWQPSRPGPAAPCWGIPEKFG
jgi:hypothetical protein